MDRRDRDFEEDWEHEEYDPEQDSDDEGMGSSRRSTRRGPPGRGGSGPYDMEDDMDDDIDMPPGYAGGRGRDHYLNDDDMDMPSHTGHHRGSMGPDADYIMQMGLLTQASAAGRRRREGGGRPQATHSMEPGSHHGHAGSRPSQDQNRFMPPSPMLSGSRHGRGRDSGPLRGADGEPLFEYIDAEEYDNGGRHRSGGGDRHRGVGGSAYGRDRVGYSDEDEDSDDGSAYPPSNSRHSYRGSAAGRGGRSHRR